MRQLCEQLQRDIEQFLDQRSALWLFLEAGECDIPVVAKLLTEVERINQTDVFFTVLANFVSPDQFVQAAWEQLAQEHAALSKEHIARGLSAPNLPLRDVSQAQTPQNQLEQLLGAVRALVPKGGSHRLVVTLAPLQLDDPEGYVRLLSGLIDASTLPSWTRSLRIIAREHPSHPHRWADAWPAQRIQRRRADFGPLAVQRAMEQTAQDPAQPDEDRRQAQLMLANLDAANGRTQSALSRYQELLSHYEKMRDSTMQAVLLNQLGELHHRTQNLELARGYYERALDPAGQAESPILTSILARNLGDLSFLSQQFAEAVEYYEHVRDLAEKMQDAEGSVIAYQKIGLAQERLGQTALAVMCYEIAEQLCQSLHIKGLEREHLVPLLRIYDQHGAKEKAYVVAQKLDRLSEVSA